MNTLPYVAGEASEAVYFLVVSGSARLGAVVMHDDDAQGIAAGPRRGAFPLPFW